MKTSQFITFLCLASIACGSMAALPTAISTIRPAVYTEPTEPQYIPVRDTERGEIVKTLGKLNVRSCPSTDCGVLRVMAEGESAYVGQLIINDDWNCHKWLPLLSEPGFICQEWTGKIDN